MDPYNDIEKFIKNLERIVFRSSEQRVRYSVHTMKNFLLNIVTSNEIENIAKTMGDKMKCSRHGTICHQCQECTIDTKSFCHNPDCVGSNGKVCGPCLRTRYGEDLAAALYQLTWICPYCRGICNCSLCRAKEGKLPAENLFQIATTLGYKSVHHFLKLQKDV